MKKVGPIRISLYIILAIILLCAIVLSTAFIVLGVRTNRLDSGLEDIYGSDEYLSPVMIDGITLVTQKISCGYAVIEMMASYLGGDITEQSLYSQYNAIVTSTGESFEHEMNICFPHYNTTMYKYLRGDELISKVYHSLANGMPVPFEWAAQLDGEWTLHYSIIVGLDIEGDDVMVLNPYGYVEHVSIEDFLRRTSFEAYKPRPFFIDLAFAFGVFEKNSIFIIDRVE